MKTKRFFKGFLPLAVFFAMTATACSSGECKGNCSDPNCKHKTTQTEGAAPKMAYDCPMHCKGAASDKPGVCPVCKMDLEAQK